MKKILSFLLLLVMWFSTGANAAEGFYVSGTKLMDCNGNEFVMRGVNYSYAWQRGHESTVIPAAKRIGCNVIRIQLSTGKKWQKCDRSTVERLIKLCEDNKLIAIFNTHDETGSMSYSDLENACDYWLGLKDLLNEHRKTVLVNISNEWCGDWNTAFWAESYMKAIPKLRDGGLKNTLIVDCAGYGQYPKSVFDRGNDVAKADKQSNVLFSMHMYDEAGKSDVSVKGNIDKALATGLPMIIGEFACEHKGNKVAWQKILDYSKEKNIGWLGWSWTGNSSEVAACDMFGGYDDSDYKTNGTNIVKGTNGIKQTSKECGYYSSGTSEPSDNVGTATLWEGSFAMGNWSGMMEYKNVDENDQWNSSAMSGLEAGDKLVFSYSDVQSGAQIQLATFAGSAWTWTELVPYADIVGGQYIYTITDDDVEMLSEHGFAVKGQKATLVKIELVKKNGGNQGGGDDPDQPSAGTELWNGSVEMGNWSGEMYYKKESTNTQWKTMAMDGLEAGDKLVFCYEDVKADGQIQLATFGAGWAWTVLVDYDDIVDNQYVYTVTADDVDMLKTYGFAVKGQNATLVSVKLVKKGGDTPDPDKPDPDQPSTSKALWEGSVEMGSWSGEMYYKNDPDNTQWKAADMKGLAVGDKLVFTYEDVKSNAQIQLATFAGSAWTWTVLVDYADIVGGQYIYTVTDDDVEMISEHGFAVKGQNATLVKVELVKKNGGDTPVDPDQPTEGTDLWNGSVDFGNWKGEMYYKKVSDNDQWKTMPMANLAVGDQLVFCFSDVESDAQIQLATFDSSWSWTVIVDYDDIVGDKYVYTVTDEYLDMIKNQGFAAKGQNATLTAVKLVKKGGDTPVDPDQPTTSKVLWEGSLPMETWSGEMYYKNDGTCDQWKAAEMASLKAGDQLVFTYTDIDQLAQIQLATFDSNWDWTEIIPYADIIGGQYVYTVTDEYAGMIKNQGFAVKGQNATLVKVELVKKSGGDTPDPDQPDQPDPDALWNGNVNLGSWSGEMYYKNEAENDQWKADVMSGLKAGDKLVFTFKDVKADAQMQLVTFGLDENWTWTPIFDYENLSGDTYTYVITDEYLENIKTRGFAVKGQNATLVKVNAVVIPGGDTPDPDDPDNPDDPEDGIDSVTIDFSAPVEIYSLDGRRIRQPEHGTLYIVRQGGKIAKILY